MDILGAVNAGELIAQRFHLAELAGSGGMGSVYRAVDLRSGALVALKVAKSEGDSQREQRFDREARALAELDHPGIVRYIAHGVTEAGERYLAMEWLSGESLSERIRQRALSEAEAVLVGIQLCDALDAAHRQGIIHRDIKPGNLILMNGELSRLKLIDFGLVRSTRELSSLTHDGVLMGTPNYVAPEQARGEASVDARADLYSVGAVLFACLAQSPPFAGDYLMVLAKLLLEPAPRVKLFRPDVSAELDQLISELLAKDASTRPASAAQVNRVLTALSATASHAPGPEVVGKTLLASDVVSRGEQRFLSVLLIGSGAGQDAGPGGAANASGRRDITATAQRYGASAEPLPDGTVVAVFSADRDPTAMATRAAYCALALHQASSAPVALATGRGRVDGALPVGEVIDRAAHLLYSGHQTVDGAKGNETLTTDVQRQPVLPREIAIDKVTASLLDRRFRVEPRDHYAVLLRENPVPRPPGKLLGKPVACVGRDRELSTMEAIFDECVAERSPRLLLMTGPAGSGKSRVAHELLHRIDHRGEPVKVWIAYGDSLRSGASFGLAGQLIRQAVGLSPAASLIERRMGIRSHMDELLGAGEADRVAAFLGELVGTPFSERHLTQIRHARSDPRLMHDQMRQAWEDWLSAESSGCPVLLVLEDLHWGDLPTVRFIDAAMRALSDRPIMVLALARPEVHEVFPGLWAARDVEQIPLRPLSRRACRALIDAVVPVPLTEDAKERLIEKSGGNPFYLEELLRDRSHAELPDTVLAMVGARLSALPADERRALRAASVFGRDFWAGGVAALLGEEPRVAAELLGRLVAAELVLRQRTSRVRGEDEYSFHHELTREAAYATLTSDDQTIAHYQAAMWLRTLGEGDPVVLAEHFFRGGQPGEALPFFHRAAEQALDADDVMAVMDYAERAIVCGASDVRLGELRLLQAEALNWSRDHARAYERGKEAMALLPRGGARWAHAAHQVSWAAVSEGQVAELTKVASALIDHAPEELGDLYVVAMAYCATHLTSVRNHDYALRLKELVQARSGGRRELSHAALATMAHMNAFLAYFAGRPDESVEALRQAVHHWENVGNQRNACVDTINIGVSLCDLGMYEDGIAAMQRGLDIARRAGLDSLLDLHRPTLAIALARAGKLEKAEALLSARRSVQTEVRHQALSSVYRAQICMYREQPARALSHIEDALKLVSESRFPDTYCFALAVRAQALLHLGRAAKALATAAEGMALVRAYGVVEEGDALLRLVHAEALWAMGRREEAVDAISQAKEQLLRRAEHLVDETWRQSLLTRVAEHRRILELAAHWTAE